MHLKEISGAVRTLLQIELGEGQVEYETGIGADYKGTPFVGLVSAVISIGWEIKYSDWPAKSDAAKNSPVGAFCSSEASWTVALVGVAR